MVLFRQSVHSRSSNTYILTFITLNADKVTDNTYIFDNYNLVCGVG